MNETSDESSSTTILNDNNLLSPENRTFDCYLFWLSILVLKMLLMSVLAWIRRYEIKKSMKHSVEHIAQRGENVKYLSVERVRRAHRNDAENILPFLLAGLAYIVNRPNETVACVLFRIGALARIVYTLLAFFVPLQHWTRIVFFSITYAITVYMCIYVLICMRICL